MIRHVFRFMVLFVFSFCVYNANLSGLWNVEVYDTVGTKLLPFSLLTGRGINVENFAHEIYKDTDAYRYFIWHNGRALPWSPIGSAVFVTPLYAPYVSWMALQKNPDAHTWYKASFLLEKLSASSIAAFNVGLFYFLLVVMGMQGVAIGGAILFAFGTPQWSTSSQFLWSHGPATTLVLVSQIVFVRGLSQSEFVRRMFFVASLLAGSLLLYVRYPLMIYPILLTVFLVYKDRVNRFLYPALLIVCVILFLIFQLYTYGSLLGPYADRWGTFGVQYMFSNLAGILFSFGRGAFWYSPFLFWSVIAYVFVRSLRERAYTTFSFHVCLLFGGIASVATWNVWWGGASFGDRLLADVSASAVLLSLFAYRHFAGLVPRALFYIAAIWSIALHGLGAFSLGVEAWNVYPVSIDTQPARVWDMRDNPVSRILAVGIPRYGWQAFLNRASVQPVYEASQRRCRLRITSVGKRFGYDTVSLEFTNLSSIPFVTSGQSLLRLRAVYRNRATGEAVVSPVPDSGLPGVIAPSQSAQTSMVLVAPAKGAWNVMIQPVQEGHAWWGSQCHALHTFESL